MQDKTERCTYDVLHGKKIKLQTEKKITTTNYLLDLEIMCDALQEISDLSSDLQKHDMAL
jgi:hypothetical protein